MNQPTLAAVRGTAVLTGGDVPIESASRLASTVQALPVGFGAAGTSSVGVGVSFALNLVTDETTSVIEENASLTGARDLTMTANARVDAVTEARMGASISDGTASVAPAIAITTSVVTTSVIIAPIGGDNLLEISGDLSAVAQQRTSAVTTSGAQAAGGSSAAVGVSLAPTISAHSVFARTDRDITAGGGIAFGALGSSHNESHASASASGASPKTENDADTSSTGGGSVADKLQSQRNFAD